MIATNTPRGGRPLERVVADRLNIHWTQFQREHPYLAASIQRTRLVGSTVERIAHDPDYLRAMESAGWDEAALEAAGRLTTIADRWVRRALGL